MDKKTFIKEMKKCKYTDKEIEEFLELAEESKKMGMEIPYDKILIIEKM